MEDRGWFRDDSSTLHLLCTLFLLLLHQLQLRSSGIRSWMLGTPPLTHSCEERILSVIHFPFNVGLLGMFFVGDSMGPGARGMERDNKLRTARPGNRHTTADEGQDRGTGLGSLPSSSHRDPVCHGLVTSSHSPGGETEAWKGGVAPRFASGSTFVLSGEDHTRGGAARGRGPGETPGLRAAGKGGWEWWQRRLVCCAQVGHVTSQLKMRLLAKLRLGGIGPEDINRLSLSEAIFIITLQ